MKKSSYFKKIKTDSKLFKILLSSLKGFFVCIFISLLGALFYWVLDLSFESLFYFSTAVYIVSSLAGGYFCGIAFKEKGLIKGSLSGLFFFIMCLFISIFVNLKIDANTLYKLLICLFSGALGGILGVNKRKKKRLKPSK